MLNKYPLWKYVLILAVLAIGFIYSAPNLYPDDPAIQISGASTSLQVKQADLDRASKALWNDSGHPALKRQPWRQWFQSAACCA
jgi:preprotein translocase subunit SecD